MYDPMQGRRRILMTLTTDLAHEPLFRKRQ